MYCLILTHVGLRFSVKIMFSTSEHALAFFWSEFELKILFRCGGTILVKCFCLCVYVQRGGGGGAGGGFEAEGDRWN